MLSRYRFFLQLQCSSNLATLEHQPFDWNGESIRTLNSLRSLEPLDVSFEDLVAKLAGFPRMFVEMDGSFVWRGEFDNHVWQIDGLIHDQSGNVQYVEVKGTATWDAWVEFSNLLVEQRDRLVVNLVDRGVVTWVSEIERILWGRDLQNESTRV